MKPKLIFVFVIYFLIFSARLSAQKLPSGNPSDIKVYEYRLLYLK